MSLKDQILQILREENGPMTIEQLRDVLHALGTPQSRFAVKEALRELDQKGLVYLSSDPAYTARDIPRT